MTTFDGRSRRRVFALLTAAVAALALLSAGPIGPAVAAGGPRVTGLSPGVGPLRGGVEVVVEGSGFTGASKVLFGSTPGTRVHVVSARRITVYSPKQPEGTVHVRVVAGAMSPKSTANRFTYAPYPHRLSWGSPVSADPQRGDLLAVSCASVSSCLAIDRNDGYVTFDGARWSAPARLPSPARNGPATDVSCSSATRCTVVYDQGLAQTRTGATWSAPVRNLPDAFHGSHVDCSSSTFCMVLDENATYVTGHDATWSAEHDTGWGNTDVLSCVSPTFCLTIDSTNRDTHRWDGRAWTTLPVPRFTAPVLYDLSCATTTFCVAVADNGLSATFDGSRWTYTTVARGVVLTSVGCPAEGVCVAVGSRTSYLLSGGRWRHVSLPVNGAAVDCPATTDCIALGSRSYTTRFDGAAWSAPDRIDPTSGRPTAVSCSSRKFCAVVDKHGFAATYTAATGWRRAVPVFRDVAARSVSCPAWNFCVAVSNDGLTSTWNGSGWAVPQTHAGVTRLVDVSCPTTSFCLAVGLGQEVAGNGNTWTVRTVPNVSWMKAVSCPDGGFCTGVTVSGWVLDRTGSGWTGATHASRGAQDLSCAARRECVLLGDAAIRHGEVWSPLRVEPDVSYGGFEPIGVSCPDRTFCAAAFDANDENDYPAVVGLRGAARDYDPPGAPLIYPAALDCPSSYSCLLVNYDGEAVLGSR